MVAWWLGCRKYKTIGPDKVNQVRHLLMFKDAATVRAHMARHGRLLREKFAAVEQTFRDRLAGLKGVEWSTPAGGYFISLEVPVGLARRVVDLASQANVKMPPAGATHCQGHDPSERHLRIAPSHLELAEVQHAAEVIALSVMLAIAETAEGVTA
ncbi:hypothetical protein [Pseudomonas sp. RIT-PI-S]|uniref:hypothetical protein n=1 Tax=Pseudomonas sp. RIT-PI-S TaxID=3035295 RepID=UPI0021D8CEAB|nr:hypothetical protein [Pseudomonas sp. RIT-PI-S]